MIGRLGRLPFLILGLLPVLILVASTILLPKEFQHPINAIYPYITIPWLAILYIGRFHDTGYSGWWTLLLILIQIGGGYLGYLGLLAVAATAGDKKANAYGEIPSGILGNLFARTKSPAIRSDDH